MDDIPYYISDRFRSGSSVDSQVAKEVDDDAEVEDDDAKFRKDQGSHVSLWNWKNKEYTAQYFDL